MTCSFTELVTTTLNAAKMLNELPPRASEAWRVLLPFVDCTTVTGVNADRSNIAIAVMLATAGDCHRELGDFRTAADWYRKATQYPGFYNYSGYYAQIVIDYRLADHVECAAEAVRRQRKWWLQRGVVYRILCYSIWWIRHGLWRPDLRREFKQLREYEDRILLMSKQR